MQKPALKKNDLENDVLKFIEENHNLNFVQSDLLQLMANSFECSKTEKHQLANYYSTVHSIYKLMESFKNYSTE